MKFIDIAGARRIIGVAADIDDEHVVPGPTLTVYSPLTKEKLGGRLFIHTSANPYSSCLPSQKSSETCPWISPSSAPPPRRRSRRSAYSRSSEHRSLRRFRRRRSCHCIGGSAGVSLSPSARAPGIRHPPRSRSPPQRPSAESSSKAPSWPSPSRRRRSRRLSLGPLCRQLFLDVRMPAPTGDRPRSFCCRSGHRVGSASGPRGARRVMQALRSD